MKSAEKGSPAAQCAVGLFYVDGLGVEKNVTKGVEWFHKAAIQEYPQAQYNYGLYLIDGKGVAANRSEGFKWIRQAALNGDKIAKDFLEKFRE